jgi:hypothetical protein
MSIISTPPRKKRATHRRAPTKLLIVLPVTGMSVPCPYVHLPPFSPSAIRLLRRNSPAVGSADRRLAQPRGTRGFAPQAKIFSYKIQAERREAFAKGLENLSFSVKSPARSATSVGIAHLAKGLENLPFPA